MVRATFVHRPLCELCDSNQTQLLLTMPFTDDAFWNFLARDYEERRVKEVLAAADYEIRECKVCGFIWQAHILGDDWMGELYETWIAAKGSLRKNAIHPLEHINCFQHKTLILLGAQAGLAPISQPILFTRRYGVKQWQKAWPPVIIAVFWYHSLF
jgi:hypothetical protein